LKKFLSTLQTHLRLMIIAVVLGLGAYAGIHLMIYVFRMIGLMS
tara:strand:- start:4706 stop:4837 length:132 start_codon:yes stop_codon:yes gene_type:complete